MVSDAHTIKVLHFLSSELAILSTLEIDKLSLQIAVDSQPSPNCQIPVHLECPDNLELAEDLDVLPVSTTSSTTDMVNQPLREPDALSKDLRTAISWADPSTVLIQTFTICTTLAEISERFWSI